MGVKKNFLLASLAKICPPTFKTVAPPLEKKEGKWKGRGREGREGGREGRGRGVCLLLNLGLATPLVKICTPNLVGRFTLACPRLPATKCA